MEDVKVFVKLMIFFGPSFSFFCFQKKKLHDYCNLSRINKKEKKRRDFMILALMDSIAYDYLGKFWQTLSNFLKWNEINFKLNVNVFVV